MVPQVPNSVKRGLHLPKSFADLPAKLPTDLNTNFAQNIPKLCNLGAFVYDDPIIA